jgi:hypothetical protein
MEIHIHSSMIDGSINSKFSEPCMVHVLDFGINLDLFANEISPSFAAKSLKTTSIYQKEDKWGNVYCWHNKDKRGPML